MDSNPQTKVQPDATFGNTSQVYPPLSAEPPAYPGPPPPQHHPPHGVHVVQGPTVVSYPGAVIAAPGTIIGGAMIVGPAVGPNPTGLVCKSCNIEIITRVERQSTTRTHVMALLLCLFGCWPCVCIPYCMDSCKNAEHYCPNCNAYIGSYNR